MRKRVCILLCLLLLLTTAATGTLAAQNDSELETMLVQPGDTWRALSLRTGSSIESLQTLNPHMNRLRQPAIGSAIIIPAGAVRTGRMLRTQPADTPLLLALAHQQPIGDMLFVPGVPLIAEQAYVVSAETPIRDYPPTFQTLELSHQTGVPGQALGLRGVTDGSIATTNITVTLSSTTIEPLNFDLFANDTYVAGLRGTGAFYPTGAHELSIMVDGWPMWSQPWLFSDGAWEFQTISFSGAAAQIDQEAIRAERARLFGIWEQALEQPLWSAEFIQPINDFVYLSSAYGVRRSYDGGANYRTYHEGVDYAAYEGTPVFATADGIVVVAEPLYVRGGSVIINHGLGIYSGVYHLSDVGVSVGDIVTAGQQVGGVGTTGLSTGNHLHWDFLVTETWVGADKWVEQGMGCWMLAGLGGECAP